MRHDLRAIMDLKPREQSPSARREIMRKLLDSIRDIELQLGAKTPRKNVDGSEMSSVEVALWRVKAIKALNHNTRLYCEYKNLEREDNDRKFGETITDFICRVASLLGGLGKGIAVSDSPPPGTGESEAGQEPGAAT